MGGGGSPTAAGSRSMRARVCARVRTPQGVGAVLFVVGGAIVGAAVVAWRRHACGRDGEDAKNHHGEHPASEEVLDGGVVEEEQGKFDQSDENLSRSDIGVEANGLDGKATEELHQIQNGKATEEIHEIQEEDKIVTDGSDGEPVEKFDQEPSRESAGIIADDMDGKAAEELHQIQNGNATEKVYETKEEDEIVTDEPDEEPEEEFDQNSSTESAEIITDDKDSGEMKNTDENSCKSDVENEITLNVTEGVDNSDQSTLTTSIQEILHGEHNEHNDGAQEIAPIQTTPTPQMMMHHRQFSEETKTETAQAELAEGTTMEKNVFEQEEQKPLAEPAELAISSVNPSLPSLLKPSEKKGFANPGWNKTGLKLKQDCTNGELSKGVTKHGVAVVTMDRRAASMAILTLIFAVTIGVNIVMRLYSSLRAT